MAELTQEFLSAFMYFPRFVLGALQSQRFASHACGAQSGYDKIKTGKCLGFEGVLCVAEI